MPSAGAAALLLAAARRSGEKASLCRTGCSGAVPAAPGPSASRKSGCARRTTATVPGACAQGVIRSQSLLEEAPCYWIVLLVILMAGDFKALQGFLGCRDL